MIYGYVRISTGKQITENQRYEITQFCEREHLTIDGWIEETISGAKNYDKRKLGTLLKSVKKGDLIICTEISRLGRSLYMVMDILSLCMDKGVSIRTIKDGFELSDNLQSKVLSFAFALAADVERSMLSERTRQALALRKAQGVKLGRPKGALSKKTKLTGKEECIQTLLDSGATYAAIARILKVDRSTLTRFCKSRDIKPTLNRNENEVA